MTSLERFHRFHHVEAVTSSIVALPVFQRRRHSTDFGSCLHCFREAFTYNETIGGHCYPMPHINLLRYQ